ncbi:hypothetical protein [Peribacillus sp. NPDC096448]|uniref:hypothetical protein n=1 Tax=Peribacillus sp. NPDC096448 TaxID=3364395 RepID=UPI003805C5F5
MGLLFEGLAANDHINIAVLDELAKAEVVVVMKEMELKLLESMFLAEAFSFVYLIWPSSS